MSNDLIPASEALQRCGYKHRNSLPALIEKLGVQPIKRNGLNYFRVEDVERYLGLMAANPDRELTDTERKQVAAFTDPQPVKPFEWPKDSADPKTLFGLDD